MSRRLPAGITRQGKLFRARRQWTCPKTGRKRDSSRLCATLEEALAWRAGTAQVAQRARPRLRDCSERWLRTRAPSLAPSTRARYCDAVALINTTLGDYWIDALRPSDLREWVAALASTHAPATIAGWLRVLRAILAEAAADGLIGADPSRSVQAPRQRPTQGRRARALESDEWRRFISAIPTSGLAPDIARLVTVAAWTGARAGELLALEWRDVGADEITIARAVWRGGVKTTKAGEPRRVPLVGPLREALEAQRAWLLTTQHPALATGIAFPASSRQALAGAGRRGSDSPRWYRATSTLRGAVIEVCRAAGLPEISPHALRRTYEGLLRSAGVDALVRRSLAGWRSEGIQAAYAQVGASERSAAGAAIVELARPKTAAKQGVAQGARDGGES